MSHGQWDNVAEMMSQERPVGLGRYTGYWMRRSPRRMLHYLAYYKFAAKLIGADKRVLDIGCAEGIGTWLLAKECGGFALGLDLDEESIGTAQANWNHASVAFETRDFLEAASAPDWDALVSFDVIEHILPEHQELWWQKLTGSLRHDGVAVIGSPTEISQVYASEISRRGHVNIMSGDRFEAELQRCFHHVFMFSAHDEVVHTGFRPLAHYQIGVGVRPRLQILPALAP